MTTLDKIIKDMENHIPETGFNLVGVDEFDEDGEQLFIMGHYETEEEAKAAQKQKGGLIYPARKKT